MFALVTGGGGFLGQYIVEQLLARGDRVRSLARGHYPTLASLGVECVRGDLRDAAAVQRACAGVDVVFHTAALAGIWGPWQDYFDVIVLGTRHVLEGCRQHRVPRLVFSSSPSVTFDGQPQEGVDEHAPYPSRWLCHYQHTKALAEQAVLEANGKGLATCALRPHLVWGPRDPHLVPRLIARAVAGQLRRVGDGANLIDMAYVENAAAAHLQAADALAGNSSVAGRAYFISQGEPVNCWQWIDEVLALAGVNPVRRHVSLAAAWRIGAVLETVHSMFGIRREPRMTRFLAAQLGTSHYFDITAARRDFGYAPQVSTAEGMQRLGATLGKRAAKVA
jgi:nucleoside-diphosphate-sugar epimerase